jgi:hypothetical protein
VIRRWYHTGYDVAKGLSGHTADVDFIKVVTYIARNHHPGMSGAGLPGRPASR